MEGGNHFNTGRKVPGICTDMMVRVGERPLFENPHFRPRYCLKLIDSLNELLRYRGPYLDLLVFGMRDYRQPTHYLLLDLKLLGYRGHYLDLPVLITRVCGSNNQPTFFRNTRSILTKANWARKGYQEAWVSYAVDAKQGSVLTCTNSILSFSFAAHIG